MSHLQCPSATPLVHTAQEVQSDERRKTAPGKSMIFTTPQYTREEVNAAASALLSYDQSDIFDWEGLDAYNAALPVINNWRSSHGYPLHTFAVTLRTYARKVDESALIAQRIKRLSSIDSKLRRFPKMRLSQMQDIGGCRAVVSSVSRVQELLGLYRASSIKHERASLDDYILEPQVSGYRGIHLVYRYASDKQKKKIYNGLKIELQLRSQYQHAWATAVETVGTFANQALKSSVGDADWLRFFALMGTAIANRERTPRVPGTPESESDLLLELREHQQRLNVTGRLTAYGEALRTLGVEQPAMQDAHYYLLVLDPFANQLTISGFKNSQIEEASEKYLDAEKRVRTTPGMDAVLVSVDSLNALQRAYPNYFADTRIFLQLVAQSLAGGRRRRVSVPASALS